MRIFSSTNEYTVIARLREGYRYTAIDLQGRQCLLVVEKKAQRAGQLTAILHEWRQNDDFCDFYEFFPYKNGIAAVFACHKGGKTLEGTIRDETYPRRAEILRSVFALVLRQNLPSEILRGVLSPENLQIYPSGKTEIFYDLPRGEAEALRRTVRLICGECTAPEINRLYAMVEDISSLGFVCLYEAAGSAADKLAEYTPPPEPEGLTLSAVKERVSTAKTAVIGRAAAVFALAAILAGYIAVGVLFYHAVIAPPRADNGISAIGTVVIDDGT